MYICLMKTWLGRAITAAGILVAAVSLSAQASAPAPTCREWHDCQRLALESYARGEYEQFHDLAWRTIQTGPTRNTDLMYLLARAQSLSGRPHDAIVMLRRLADMGFVIADAATNTDFRAVREHPQWPELESVIATASRPAGAPAPTGAVMPPTPTAAVTRRGEEALRIPRADIGSAGLAYDSVSSRFVVADAGLRKLMIIDERSGHVVDLVTSASAGFYDITGLDIDPTRGDLWVVSAERGSAADREPASALHRVQLVSGRPLDRILVPVELQPGRLDDVAVTRAGVVLVLDTVGNRILRLRAATHTLTSAATLHLQRPVSLAPAGDRLVYVAHESGIARVDTVTGRVTSVTSGPGVQLTGFERIRWARDSLLGVQRLPDGSRIAVRIRIVDSVATASEVIDNSLTGADNFVAAVSGDEFYFLVHQPGSDAGDVVIRRSRLR
jgi:hypothetical protein